VPLIPAAPAHDIERPVPLTTGCFAQLVPESDLLDIPRRGLHLDHIHVDDSPAFVPHPLAALVECSTLDTLEASFASMKAGRRWVRSCTSQQKWIGLDCSVYRSLVPIKVDLRNQLSMSKDRPAAYR